MRLRLLEFVLHEALINLRRNGLMTLAAITTVAVSLTILGAFVMALLSLDALATSLPVRLNEIAVFLKDGLSAQDKVLLQAEIQRIPGVESVRLIPKEEAWPRFKKTLGEDTGLDDIKNPLDDAFRVKMKDPELTEAAAALIGRRDGVRGVKFGKTELKMMLVTANVIRIVGSAVGIALIIGTCLIVSNAIRLTVFARRREIRIMQLVGATGWLIRMPFIVEGMFHGLVGGLIASGILLLGVNYLVSLAHEMMPFLPKLSQPVELDVLCLVLSGFGILLGAAGSFVSIRRFLKI